MKKNIIILLAVLMIITLTGCSKIEKLSGKNGKQPNSVSDVLQQGMSAEDEKKNGSESSPAAPEQPDEPAVVSPQPSRPDYSGKIDVDLTVLSSTMVYSEVYNMMMEPDKYIGKTVKMKGIFVYYHDQANDVYYFACIIADATACCAQGIEFVLTDDYRYPDDYPEPESEITVIGVFDTYIEDEMMYCTLRNAILA